MNKMYESLEAVIKKNEWPFSNIKENVIGINIIGENNQWVGYARCIPENDQFVFYSICSSKAPEEKREAIMEFVTDINYDLIIGNFEHNLLNGDIRFKTSIHFKGTEEYNLLIEQVIVDNILTMNHYLTGFMGIIHGGLTPKEALQKLEENNTITSTNAS